MLLLRTVCNTDWKGRPSHKVALIARSDNREGLVKAQNDDVHNWMADDIAMDECNEKSEEEDLPNDWETKRSDELALDKTLDLKAMWEIENERFEMRLADTDHREFVESTDGEFTTIVYHFKNDDLSDLD